MSVWKLISPPRDVLTYYQSAISIPSATDKFYQFRISCQILYRSENPNCFPQISTQLVEHFKFKKKLAYTDKWGTNAEKQILNLNCCFWTALYTKFHCVSLSMTRFNLGSLKIFGSEVTSTCARVSWKQNLSCSEVKPAQRLSGKALTYIITSLTYFSSK